MEIVLSGSLEEKETTTKLPPDFQPIGGMTPPSVRRGQLRRLHSKMARANRAREAEKIAPPSDDSDGTEIPGEGESLIHSSKVGE